MTLEQIEKTLPNGFHDAFVKTIHIDYVQRQAMLELEVCTGGPEQEGSEREAYRALKLRLSGLLLFAVDVANREYLEPAPHGLSLQAAPPDYRAVERADWPAEPLPEGAFYRSFYFAEGDSFLHVAATGAACEWLSEARRIY